MRCGWGEVGVSMSSENESKDSMEVEWRMGRD